MIAFFTGKVLEGTTTLTIRKTKFTVTNLDADHVYVPDNSFSLKVREQGCCNDKNWAFSYTIRNLSFFPVC